MLKTCTFSVWPNLWLKALLSIFFFTAVMRKRKWGSWKADGIVHLLLYVRGVGEDWVTWRRSGLFFFSGQKLSLLALSGQITGNSWSSSVFHSLLFIKSRWERYCCCFSSVTFHHQVRSHFKPLNSLNFTVHSTLSSEFSFTFSGAAETVLYVGQCRMMLAIFSQNKKWLIKT